MEHVYVSVITYKNEIRKKRMEKRFKSVGVDVVFTPEVEWSDFRLCLAPERDKRAWAIMLPHLDTLLNFITSDKKYCLVCEDDVHISKTLSDDLKVIIPVFDELKLDLLLLGCLLPYKVSSSNLYGCNYLKSVGNFSIFEYPFESTWGTQMYLITRPYAIKLVTMYNIDFAISNNTDDVFAADWIITKKGKCALIQPFLGVEEGGVSGPDNNQNKFHNTCNHVHFDPLRHV